MFDINQVLMTQLDLVARLSRTEDNLLRASFCGSLALDPPERRKAVDRGNLVLVEHLLMQLAQGVYGDHHLYEVSLGAVASIWIRYRKKELALCLNRLIKPFDLVERELDGGARRGHRADNGAAY